MTAHLSHQLNSEHRGCLSKPHPRESYEMVCVSAPSLPRYFLVPRPPVLLPASCEEEEI